MTQEDATRARFAATADKLVRLIDALSFDPFPSQLPLSHGALPTDQLTVES